MEHRTYDGAALIAGMGATDILSGTPSYYQAVCHIWGNKNLWALALSTL